jgi:hypothetical protein
MKVRGREVDIIPGYDGVFGQIKIKGRQKLQQKRLL